MSLPTGPQVDPTLGDSVGGVIFEFEEDFETTSATSHGEQFVSDTEDDDLLDDEVVQTPAGPTTSTTAATAVHRVPTGSGASKTDLNSSRLLATSVPVSIPQRLAATWHDRGFANWSSDEEDDDPEDHRAFEKPHEVIAKTYQEHYMKTGDLQFEVPVSESRKIKALI
eukprot:TRINITY_DN370_c0_g2_i1.p1 TRINITY_DN370_c0_g2~~TRINITY_DN370_c0_g2_i1.p1  ORF type:complete len:168 (-),score=42.44 TRINITY_DN370_c0_g2_i1:539-1042(-)